MLINHKKLPCRFLETGTNYHLLNEGIKNTYNQININKQDNVHGQRCGVMQIMIILLIKKQSEKWNSRSNGLILILLCNNAAVDAELVLYTRLFR